MQQLLVAIKVINLHVRQFVLIYLWYFDGWHTVVIFWHSNGWRDLFSDEGEVQKQTSGYSLRDPNYNPYVLLITYLQFYKLFTSIKQVEKNNHACLQQCMVLFYNYIEIIELKIFKFRFRK